MDVSIEPGSGRSMAPQILALNCWVYGQDIERLFRVDISSTKDVLDLKRAIKNEKTDLRDMSVDLLTVYKVFYPETENADDELEQWNPDGNQWLGRRDKLSKVFKKCNTAEWLIVVTTPNSQSRLAADSVLPDMTIKFWLRGDPGSSVSNSVKISSTETVTELKKAIKDVCSLDLPDGGAGRLTLYKAPPLSKDENLQDALNPLSISSLGDSLRDVDELSAVLLPLATNVHLHLIVDGLVTIDCWIRGAKLSSTFGVRTQLKSTVNTLKNTIKAAHEDLHGIPPDRLNLYKASVNNELELQEIIGALGSGQLLQGSDNLAKIFDDVPFSQPPRIVVEPLTERISRPRPQTYRHTSTDDPITTRRNEFLKYASKQKPSATGTPSTFRARQSDPLRCKAIPCGRPREYEETIPTTLLHPILGQFVDDCQTVEVTATDNELVEILAVVMSDFYMKEDERVDAVKAAFHASNINFTRYVKSGYVPDADIVTANEHRCMIAEFKNEMGNTSAEPYFQVIGYYLESTRESALIYNRSPLPCLLIAVSGPHVTFAGAAWNLRPTVQLLSTPIAFHFHSTDTHNRLTAARHMAAFRNAVKNLRQYYDNLQVDTQLPATASDPPHLFPHPTSYTSLHDRTTKHFQYVIDLEPDRLIFLGTEEKKNDICIKFVRTYSCAAHQYLVSLGCAPALRGFEKIPGGWFMVVMDMLPVDFETLHARQEPLPSSVFADMTAKLELFHTAGFVHGDIRETNLMVSKSNEKQFMIIDFDWAGKIGEARYPPCVNYKSVGRPDGARDGKDILAAHDVDMLQRIITPEKYKS